RAARVGPGEGDVVLPVATQDGDVPAERGRRGVGEVDAGHLVPRPADDAHPEGPARGRYARAAVGEARLTEIGPDGVLAGAPGGLGAEKALRPGGGPRGGPGNGDGVLPAPPLDVEAGGPAGRPAGTVGDPEVVGVEHRVEAVVAGAEV